MTRRISWIILAGVAGLFAGLLSAQTVTVPPASSSAVVLNWTDPGVCGTPPCTFQAYRVPGTVTIVAGTTGATALPVTAAGATTLTDASVTVGNVYSYAVETIQGGLNSVPSTTVTVTIPTPPPPPVMGTVIAENKITVKNGTSTVVATTTTSLREINNPAATGK